MSHETHKDYRIDSLTPEYGDEVVITKGRFKGRVGIYDDDNDTGKKAIVYFGYPTLTRGSYDVSLSYIRLPTVDDLVERSEFIRNSVMRDSFGIKKIHSEEKINLLIELNLIDGLIFERLNMRLHGKHAGTPTKVFLSHASADKWFVRRINDDLRYLGHEPWLDEVAIKAGDPLVEIIEQGVEAADFLVVFISEASIQSGWVRAEWESQILKEMGSRKVKVIAARLDDSEVPPILKRKKYIDFREGYFEGFEELLRSIGHSRK